MPIALRSVGRLDVLSSTPAAPSGCAPCIHARLHRLATKSGEESGLGEAVPKLARGSSTMRIRCQNSRGAAADGSRGRKPPVGT